MIMKHHSIRKPGLMEIFDAEAMTYSFTQQSRAVEVETQYLYYTEMKIIDWLCWVEGKERLKEEVKLREKRRQERRNRKETKRKRQGCDSAFLAYASLHWCVRAPVRPSGAGTSRIKCGHKHAISNIWRWVCIAHSAIRYNTLNTVS